MEMNEPVTAGISRWTVYTLHQKDRASTLTVFVAWLLIFPLSQVLNDLNQAATSLDDQRRIAKDGTSGASADEWTNVGELSGAASVSLEEDHPK